MPRSLREEHAAETRQALVTAARPLFAGQGYAATGTEQIVSAAGVTRGALYHHFRDKTALFRAVVEEVARDVAEQVTARVLDDPSAEDPGAWAQLRAGFRCYLDVCTRSDFQRIVLIDGPAALGRGAWEELVDRYGYDLLDAWLGRAVEERSIPALPLPALARLLAAVIAEASLYIARAADPDTARADIGETVDRVLDGLTRQPGEDQAGDDIA